MRCEMERSVGDPVRPGECPGVVTFAEGLVGLPSARRFAFESSEEIAPFLRMRSLDQPGLSFLVVDPRLVIPDYRPSFPGKAATGSDPVPDRPRLVLAIATISPRIEECTANLMAPLVIDPDALHGSQIVLEAQSYSPRQPLVGAGS